MLEKKKDYLVRAQAFHSKENRIKALRKKAENRNPDEFYFKMVSSKTKGGVHAAESEHGRLSVEMLQVLRTQDRGYIKTLKGAEDKRVERLKSTLHVVSSTQPLNKHTVFVDSEEAAATFDASQYLGTDPALLGRAFNRPRVEQLEAGAGPGGGEGGAIDKGARKAAKKARKLKDKAYGELDARMERSEKLGQLAEHMELKKALLAKGRRTKIKDADGDAPAVYKWFPERKR